MIYENDNLQSDVIDRMSLQSDALQRVHTNGGIWLRSNALGQQEYIIFASDYDKDTTMQFLRQQKINFKDMRDAYDITSTGEKVVEDCFIINSKDFDNASVLFHAQESILALGGVNADDSRDAQLIFNSNDYALQGGTPCFTQGETQDVGTMRQVSKEKADQSDYWTYCAYTDTYFIAE